MVKSRYSLITLALLAMIIGALYYGYLKSRSDSDEASLLSNNGADMIMYKVKVRQFNRKGKLEKTLSSTIAKNYINQDKKTILSKPNITISHKNGEWLIQSKKATSFDGNQRVLFSGKVTISNRDKKGKIVSTIVTQDLWYYPKTQQISTIKNINLTRHGLNVTAKGMRANLKNENIELLRNARGNYVPNTM